MFGADSWVWRRVSPFETYLRYGRRDAETSAVGPWSVKFNQWHDPRDGRFTFGPGSAAMGKRPRPFAGGGGGGSSFDGGGSGGSWERNAPHLHYPVTATQPHTSSSQSHTGGMRTVDRNGYRFAIDAEGRTREVTGRLTLGQAGSRSRTEQARAGVPDRLTSDDGGHYIAARFNGPKEAFNHFAQDRNFNRSTYLKLENEWARDIRKGNSVTVDIAPVYSGRSIRPDSIVVDWKIGNAMKRLRFANRPKGK